MVVLILMFVVGGLLICAVVLLFCCFVGFNCFAYIFVGVGDFGGLCGLGWCLRFDVCGFPLVFVLFCGCFTLFGLLMFC